MGCYRGVLPLWCVWHRPGPAWPSKLGQRSPARIVLCFPSKISRGTCKVRGRLAGERSQKITRQGQGDPPSALSASRVSCWLRRGAPLLASTESCCQHAYALPWRPPLAGEISAWIYHAVARTGQPRGCELRLPQPSEGWCLRGLVPINKPQTSPEAWAGLGSAEQQQQHPPASSSQGPPTTFFVKLSASARRLRLRAGTAPERNPSSILRPGHGAKPRSEPLPSSRAASAPCHRRRGFFRAGLGEEPRL